MAFVAQYKEGELKAIDKLEPSDSVIAKASGVDQIKGFLWDTESLQPLSEPAVISGSDEKEFINAGIANSYTVRFSGISGERCQRGVQLHFGKRGRRGGRKDIGGDISQICFGE